MMSAKKEVGEVILKKVASFFNANLDDAVTKTGEASKGQMTRTDGSTYALMGDDLLRIQGNIDQYKGAGKLLLGLSVPALASFTNTSSKPPKNKKEATEFEKAFSKAFKDGEETFKFKGKEYTTELRRGKAEGSLMIPPEGMPVDTYPNIPPEEMEEAMASQLPDEDMEEGYINFIMDESLADEEQEYLADVIEKDPKLSDILDKVITTASEFSGAGEVDGPGTGVSDSIPARLSDGEFVFTKKATDQIGADNLQVMMDDAERAYDGGLQQFAFGGMADKEDELEDSRDYLSKTDEEIKKVMIGSNRMPSVR